VITNREISSEALLEEALDEVTESATTNGLSRSTVAAVLRAHADQIESGDDE
jgi:hypothetical protein